MATERELRTEYEGLQARARALRAELASAHGPGFLERRAALTAALQQVLEALQGRERQATAARAELATLDEAVESLAHQLRAAEQRRLPAVTALLVPAVLWLGGTALTEEALRTPGAVACALALGLLFGGRVVGPGAPAPVGSAARGAGLGEQVANLWAFLPVLVTLFAGFLTLFASSPGNTWLHDLGSAWARPLALLALLLSTWGWRRSAAASRPRRWETAGVGFLALALVLWLAKGDLLPGEALHTAAPSTARQLERWVLHGLGHLLWALLAAWVVAAQVLPRARRLERAVSALLAVGALVAVWAAAAAQARLPPHLAHGPSPFDDLMRGAWLGTPGPRVLAVQLSALGLMLGVRSLREPGRARWPVVAANGVVLLLALALGVLGRP